MDDEARKYLASLPPEEREGAAVWLEEMAQLGAATLEEARGIDHAIGVSLAQGQVDRVQEALATGEHPPRGEVARALECAAWFSGEVEIPPAVLRQGAGIIQHKTPRGRRATPRVFPEPRSVFARVDLSRDVRLAARYEVLRKEGKSQKEALEIIAQEFQSEFRGQATLETLKRAVSRGKKKMGDK